MEFVVSGRPITLPACVLAHLRSHHSTSCLALMLGDKWMEGAKKDEHGRVLLDYDVDSFAFIIKILHKECLELQQQELRREIANLGCLTVPPGLRKSYDSLSDLLGLRLSGEQHKFPLTCTTVKGEGEWIQDEGRLTTSEKVVLWFPVKSATAPTIAAFTVEASTAVKPRTPARLLFKIAIVGQCGQAATTAVMRRDRAVVTTNGEAPLLCFSGQQDKVGIGVLKRKVEVGMPLAFQRWNEVARTEQGFLGPKTVTWVRVKCRPFTNTWRTLPTVFTFKHGKTLEECV
ncbi:unnamed protein product [Vitrella brassicaformis CCMP3155]|uniref:Uncharacterized protein n=1 Tax=Vitrella brassicaformis (strain CCMP3155) TaxID=1169540 RepID=A0A0G4ELF5_VITBC|nr:unnamed protein product [Vitrella brassicaformis CCMP3155]|eukprot:CEL97839.1 unnamed protein product [Vitrella brassicaformis CCMP3155]